MGVSQHIENALCKHAPREIEGDLLRAEGRGKGGRGRNGFCGKALAPEVSVSQRFLLRGGN